MVYWLFVHLCRVQTSLACLLRGNNIENRLSNGSFNTMFSDAGSAIYDKEEGSEEIQGLLRSDGRIRQL